MACSAGGPAHPSTDASVSWDSTAFGSENPNHASVSWRARRHFHKCKQELMKWKMNLKNEIGKNEWKR